MAKKNENVNVETPAEPYIHEETKSNTLSNKLSSVTKSRGAKIAAIVAGSALAVGTAFGVGFSAGNVSHPGFDGQASGQHQQGFGPDGGKRDGHGDQQRPPRDGGVNGFGNADGDGPHGKPGERMAPNDGQLPAPSATSGSATTAP